ncbi:MAG: ABC transporter ATP-binding protein [FCB group bacterium]|nr:ABC transporter ATP-binding protein [FCB group bacterium]
MLLLTNTFMVYIPYLLSQMIEVLEVAPIDVARLKNMLLIVFLAAVAGAIIRVISRLLIFNTGRIVEYELRTALFKHMQRMPASVFASRPIGDLVSRSTNDLNSVRLLFGFGMLNLLNTPLLFIMTVVVMAKINLRLTPAVLLVFPVVILGVRSYARRMFDLTQQIQGTLGDISTTAQESFSAVQVIKSYSLEEHQTAKIDHLSQRYLSMGIRLALIRNILFNVMAAIIGLSELVLIGFGGWEIIHGRLTIGELVAFNVYLGMMIWPTMALGFILSVWQRGMAAMSRIEEILAEPVEDSVLKIEAGEPWRRPDFWQKDIEIRGLTWRYPDGPADGKQELETEPVLQDVSMQIAGGRFTALIGPTGCGKSTLAKILPRLYNPPSGTVFINGVDLTAIPLETLRQNVGLATQETFLFSRSLAENIGFGRPGVDHKEIIAAAGNAVLDRDLEEFSNGYETLVGERGITISGGQRQRAAIARLLVYKTPIMILDDSFSAVDLKTEQRILSHLRTRLAGRTVLLITHRIAIAGEAEQIFVMDQGRIVEQGLQDELLAAGGIYARLAEIQQLSDDMEPVR